MKFALNSMRTLLVNTNLMRPPIAPIGLDYLADALHEAGAQVEVLDLSFEPRAVATAVAGCAPDVVGVTLRNTDDCYFAGQDFFLPKVKDLTDAIGQATNAPVVLGGVGFSIMPEAILRFCALDYGVWGEGEFVFPDLARRLSRGEAIQQTPGLVYRINDSYHRNRPGFGDLKSLPTPSRSWVDNPRYFREGGQIGFETKRGCDRSCLFCADPVAKGKTVRLHSPQRVADELKGLLGQGVDHFHTCDAEFNLPEDHALAVCRAITESGLGDQIRWYAYSSPKPFARELADAMVRSGCAGIDFGVDHSDEAMLNRLGRDHRAEDLERIATLCHDLKVPFMFDLLLGGPGETRETLQAVIEFMKRINPSRVGLSVGVRVYPGTPLASLVATSASGLRIANCGLTNPGAPESGTRKREPQTDLLPPVFYISPAVGDDIFSIVGDLVGDDPRFFFADPTKREQNYNYNANQVLEDAIAAGHRGAYWDILRRLAD